MKKFFIILLLALLVSVFIGITYVNSNLEDVPQLEENITLEVPQNSSIDDVVEIFNEKELLKPNWLFSYYLMFKTQMDKEFIKAGIFEIEPGMSNEEIVELLFKGGEAKTITITIPEGLDNKEIADILSGSMKFTYDDFIELTKDESLLEEYSIEADNCLGYLLPETYEFYENETAEGTIRKMLNAHKELWNPAREELLKSLGMTKHELLTLASIVEAETTAKDEFDTVAGLYHNRVKKGMLLQADPTVQFSIGSKRKLYKRDLKVDNPYNTYKYAGLPPGPINNPGKRAILASLSPENHDYLYMVAKGDGSEEHFFAKTNAEHISNVYKYKRNRRSR